MELYGSVTSPFVRHCRIALLEEGFDFTLIPTDADQSAALSPAKRVPFLRDGDLFLSDSTAILHHIRQRAGKVFFSDPRITDQYCLANTVLDSAINLFLLEKQGHTPATIPYLARQQTRVESSLVALEKTNLTIVGSPNDAQWRVAVLIGWTLYRDRCSYGALPRLAAFYDAIAGNKLYVETAPPA